MWGIAILYPAGRTIGLGATARTSTLNAAVRASTSEQVSPIAAAAKRILRAMRRNSTLFVAIAVDRVALALRAASPKPSRALSLALTGALARSDCGKVGSCKRMPVSAVARSRYLTATRIGRSE
jgi:hypothetical protein